MVLDFGDFPFEAFAAAVRRVTLTRLAARCVSFRFIFMRPLNLSFFSVLSLHVADTSPPQVDTSSPVWG